MGNELAEQVAAADPEAAARTRVLRIWLRENGRWSVPHPINGRTYLCDLDDLGR
jgi:hypothetical protein